MKPNYQPALIRAFFSSFTEGIISESINHDGEKVELTAKNVKEIMLEYYEEISMHFFDILFNPLAVIHYNSAEELISILKSPEVAPTIKTPVDLFKYVCKTPEAHEAMVTEYRRNFTSLLSGRVLPIEDFYEGFPANYLADIKENAEIPVRLLTQTVVKSFYAGRNLVLEKSGKDSSVGGTNQVRIFRLLIENMQCMLHAEPLEFSEDANLNEMFFAVCVTPENMNTMLSVMQQTIQQTIQQSCKS